MENIYTNGAMEQLCQLSKDTEIWWDSNPLIYEEWCKEFINSVPENLKDNISAQLKRLWNKETNPNEWIFKGVTTNPSLTKVVFEKLKNEWDANIKELISYHPYMSDKEIAWEAYKEACKRGAAYYMPLFEKSSAKYGYVSAQVDPRFFTTPREMIAQGLELKKLQPNIMIKIPATKAGIHVIFILTSLGIPTNATLCFTLPQVMAVAEAVKKGKNLGEIYGTNYSHWRSVITIMVGRFEDAKIFEEQAAERGINLTEEMKRWAGIAITKKACKIMSKNNYPSKILLASSRIGPKINEVQNIWHIEKLAGCNLIFTMNPSLIESFMVLYINRPLQSHRDEFVPDEIMKKLLQIPYFAEGYSEKSIKCEDFERIEPTITTYNQFSQAMRDIENYVKTLF